MRNFSLILCLLLVFPVVSCAGPVDPSPSTGQFAAPHRCVFIVRDVSESYCKQLALAQPKLEEILRALGPGDEVTLLDAGLAFQPRSAVRIQSTLPGVPSSLFQPTRNINEYKKRQQEVDSRWSRANADIAAMVSFVARPVQTERIETDIFGVFEYISHRVNSPGCEEIYLFPFTDLHHEFKGEATEMPPRATMAFDRLRVEAFFLPWINAEQWQAKENAWRQWFVRDGHATRFAMFDEAASQKRSPLIKNRTPRKVPSPF